MFSSTVLKTPLKWLGKQQDDGNDMLVRHRASEYLSQSHVILTMQQQVTQKRPGQPHRHTMALLVVRGVGWGIKAVPAPLNSSLLPSGASLAGWQVP
jgi:hypothetical protein